LSTQGSRGSKPSTVLRDDDVAGDKFSRRKLLDRPFLSQSPGYGSQGEHRRDPDHVTSVIEAEELEAQRGNEVLNEASPSVDDIVAMLASGSSNRHYQTGGRPGLFVKHARKVKQRIAGAPIE
jgi:hypothetical protein